LVNLSTALKLVSIEGSPVAIVEAEDNNHTVSHGMQQVFGYAQILEVPWIKIVFIRRFVWIVGTS